MQPTYVYFDHEAQVEPDEIVDIYEYLRSKGHLQVFDPNEDEVSHILVAKLSAEDEHWQQVLDGSHYLLEQYADKKIWRASYKGSDFKLIICEL
jgi:hypothetical protein